MRAQGDIEDRIRFLLTEELSRRVREAESQLPHLCVHNHRQPLDSRKTVEDAPNETYNRTSDRNGLPVVQTIGLCMVGADNPEEWPGNICEDPIDAQRCPMFRSITTKTAVYETFKTNLEDIDWVRHNMPELWGLLWVLDASTSPALPWWKRLWFKMLRIHVAPMVRSESAVALLPASPEE
jgi:hypothetical protein